MQLGWCGKLESLTCKGSVSHCATAAKKMGADQLGKQGSEAAEVVNKGKALCKLACQIEAYQQLVLDDPVCTGRCEWLGCGPQCGS